MSDIYLATRIAEHGQKKQTGALFDPTLISDDVKIMIADLNLNDPNAIQKFCDQNKIGELTIKAYLNYLDIKIYPENIITVEEQ